MDIIKIRILNKDNYSQYFDLINIFRETSSTEEEFINNLLKINNN